MYQYRKPDCMAVEWELLNCERRVESQAVSIRWHNLPLSLSILFEMAEEEFGNMELNSQIKSLL